jgi:nucleoside-diphosphate-sugar epimerase
LFCYVLGHGETLNEDFISHPKGLSEFNNHYEHTKWLAEELFRDVKNALIIRPAVVVGNSETGITEKEDGPYFVINFLKKLGGLALTCPNLGRKDIYVNTVPVDTLCKISVNEVLQHQENGFTQKIVNVADPNPPTTWEYYETAVKTITQKIPYKFDPLKSIILKLLRLPGIHLLTGIKPTTLDYFSWEGKIKTKNVKLEQFPKMLEHLPRTIFPKG